MLVLLSNYIQISGSEIRYLYIHVIAWEPKCSMCHFKKKWVLYIIFIVTISSILTQFNVKEKGVKSLDILYTILFCSISKTLNLSVHKFSSIFDTFKDRTLTCLFVLIYFEVLRKCSLKEQLKNPLQYLF